MLNCCRAPKVTGLASGNFLGGLRLRDAHECPLSAVHKPKPILYMTFKLIEKHERTIAVQMLGLAHHKDPRAKMLGPG